MIESFPHHNKHLPTYHARAVSETARAVMRKKETMKKKYSTWPQDLKDEIIKSLLDKRKTAKQLMEEYDLSETQLYSWRKKYVLRIKALNGTVNKDTDIKRLQELMQKKLTEADIIRQAIELLTSQ
jgi:transposase-like protein